MAAGDVSIKLIVSQAGAQAFDFVGAKLSALGTRAGLSSSQIAMLGGAGRTAGHALMTMGSIGMSALGMIYGVGRKVASLMFSLPGLIAGVSAAFVAKSFVDAASTVEQYRLRLRSLLGTQAAANKALEFAGWVAAKTSSSYNSVAEAAVKLEAFGVEHKKWLPVLSDLSAMMDVTMADAADDLGRAYAGGVQAAIIFRNKGILNIIKDFKGIDDLTNLTLPEFRQAMYEAFTDPRGKIFGSAARLSTSWRGMLSELGDAWFRFRLRVMESGPFEWMKGQLRGTLDVIDDWKAQGKIDDWATAFGGALVSAGEATKKFVLDQISSVEQFGLGETIIRDIEDVVPWLASIGWSAGKVLGQGIIRGYFAEAKEHPIISTLIAAGTGAKIGGTLGGLKGAGIGAVIGAGANLSMVFGPSPLPPREQVSVPPPPQRVLSPEAQAIMAQQSWRPMGGATRLDIVEGLLGDKTYREKNVQVLDKLAGALDRFSRIMERRDRIEAFGN